MQYEGKLRSRNTSYCLIEVVTKAGLTIYYLINTLKFNILLVLCQSEIKSYQYIYTLQQKLNATRLIS